jgi:hypothetical protein
MTGPAIRAPSAPPHRRAAAAGRDAAGERQLHFDVGYLR